MYFNSDDPHGLPRDPYKACIVPRPIGWISTISKAGRANLAPYSFFNAIAETPRMVMLCVNGNQADGRLKDTLSNIVEVPEFVVNAATWDLREAMNVSCLGATQETDEFTLAGLTKGSAVNVRPPLVVESPMRLECSVHQLIELPPIPDGGRNVMIIGRVDGVHIADDILVEGRVDPARYKPLGRLGYSQYVVAGVPGSVFEMRRPEEADVGAIAAAAEAGRPRV